MTITLEIPDELAERLQCADKQGEISTLPRRVLEAFAAEEYRQGRLHKPDLRRWLGFETSDQIDTFLRSHEVWIEYTAEDLARERAGFQRLGY